MPDSRRSRHCLPAEARPAAHERVRTVGPARHFFLFGEIAPPRFVDVRLGHPPLATLGMPLAPLKTEAGRRHRAESVQCCGPWPLWFESVFLRGFPLRSPLMADTAGMT